MGWSIELDVFTSTLRDENGASKGAVISLYEPNPKHAPGLPYLALGIAENGSIKALGRFPQKGTAKVVVENYAKKLKSNLCAILPNAM